MGGRRRNASEMGKKVRKKPNIESQTRIARKKEWNLIVRFKKKTGYCAAWEELATRQLDGKKNDKAPTRSIRKGQGGQGREE